MPGNSRQPDAQPPDDADVLAASGPRVSILLPVYNAQAYLPQAIDCILAQSFTDWELLAVDDGSVDRSRSMLEGYARRDDRIRVISRPNTGIVGALNDALAAARGPLIARMDADDLCTPGRLETQIAFMDRHRDHAAVGCWVQRVDPYGSPVGMEKPPTDHAAIDAALLRGDGSAIVHATTVIRRDALQRVGAWRAQYNWVEDIDLFLRLAEVGRLANIPVPMYSYRRHLGSVCLNRYQQMCRSLEAVMHEAYARRGIAEPFDVEQLRTRLVGTSTTADFFRNWACHAIQAGNLAIARRHAVAALFREPWSPRSWRVMYWAMTG